MSINDGGEEEGTEAREASVEDDHSGFDER